MRILAVPLVIARVAVAFWHEWQTGRTSARIRAERRARRP